MTGVCGDVFHPPMSPTGHIHGDTGEAGHCPQKPFACFHVIFSLRLACCLGMSWAAATARSRRGEKDV